jgi:predicted ATP-dependent endonuclease of OLD family
MPKICSINIKNFRSISELEIAATDLTVIVGDNDSGKSNVLRALNLFFNGQTNPNTPFNFLTDYNRYAEPRAKKAPEIIVELKLELPESYRENNGDFVIWRKRWRAEGLQRTDEYAGFRRGRRKRGGGFHESEIEITTRSRVRPLLSRIKFEYVPAVRSAEFFRELRGRIFQVIAQASEQTVRASSGQFEGVISAAVADLLSDIFTELNDESKLRLPNDLTSIFESLDFLNGEKSISLESRGDGIKARYIPLILKFIADKGRERGGIPQTFIWAYEEPENNLEFRRAQSLAEAFRKLALGEFTQVFLTTHSPIFYNMHLEDDEIKLCSAYHLSHLGPEAGTKASPAHEARVSLDESMGAMAIIAPHVRDAQDALAEACAQRIDLQNKLKEYNQRNLPTIFVEGATEYIVFSELLARRFPENADKIFLAEPPSRAGANYAANMLRSWEFKTKHQMPSERVRAVAIIDNDGEGRGAKTRFLEDSDGYKYVDLLTLNTPEHLQSSKKNGIDIPVTLEELWPRDCWLHAEKSGWLKERPRKGLISSALADILFDTDKKLSDVIDDDWEIYLKFRASDETDSGGTSKKVLWANYVTGLPDDIFLNFAKEHIAALGRAFSSLKI